MFKTFIYLFFFTKIFVTSQQLLYQDKNDKYSINVEAVSFFAARRYCESLTNGNLAMIKNRNLTGKIEASLIKVLKQNAGK